MKLALHDGRAVIVLDGAVVDLATASDGRFGPDMASVYRHWAEARALGETTTAGTAALDESRLGLPVDPRQVFAIGLNYRAHAAETGATVPDVPATFTKFPACLTGPFEAVELSGDTVDWEVELVVVIGTRADRALEADGWSHVAGLTVGQDISDRTLQVAAGRQFSLGKSYRGYGPVGPYVVTPDELADPDDLALGCSVDGEVVQSSRTGDMVFSVPRLVAELSAVVPLLPGDIIFTGTPAGVGRGRKPPRYLRSGNVLETWIEGIGRMRNRFV
jgi:2-keto-4-pentenoate hydratase/2-oxohepta-3-ene-1,7-dioic acid hydratase in catechol pathway